MEWRINLLNADETLEFAAGELKRYLRKMDPTTDVAILRDAPESEPSITLSVHADLSKKYPTHTDAVLDDSYDLLFERGCGHIYGSNSRSVLLGSYRLLRELGCRWLRPGEQGEKIPLRTLSDCKEVFRIAEGSSYRHRGVCIEGCCSYESISALIDFLPKLGMNSYFTQFLVPQTFFDRWYRRMYPGKTDAAIVSAMTRALIREIKIRGLLYHAVGHGWTCEPFGIQGRGWEEYTGNVPEEARQYFAEIGGKRALYKQIPLFTNLCYSNPRVQDLLVDYIVDYCKNNPHVDYLHFWLADDVNNHCECANCAGTRPSDFYVQMLNKIDCKLTELNLSTHLVFLIYYDLLWAPERERLLHQDRFTLMFAPITRSYTKPIHTCLEHASSPLAPYVRNRLDVPKDIGENVAHLKQWQAQFQGDSFTYEYHLWKDYYVDLGGIACAKVLYEDMKHLKEIGINGMISCQSQRPFFPTGLAMIAMTAVLWNREVSFEEVSSAYFQDLFGTLGAKIYSYLEKVSQLLDPAYLRGEKASVSEESVTSFTECLALVNQTLPLCFAQYEQATNACDRLTWKELLVHGMLCIQMAHVLRIRAQGKREESDALWEQVKIFLDGMELPLKEVFDESQFTAEITERFQGQM